MADSSEPFSLEDVTVAFRRGETAHHVLSGLSLDIRPGEWVAIAGRNGSGKSTLARVAAGLLPVSGGRVNRGWSAGQRIGVVLQSPEAQLIGETVGEDLTFGMEMAGVAPERMPGIAAKALAQTGLAGLEERPVAQLSGGQKQLLALAGCLAAGAGLYVFDEATAMLDPLSAKRVREAAMELKRGGAAVLWVTQRLEELAAADRVLVLEGGRAVFEGSPEKFFYGGTVLARGSEGIAKERGAAEGTREGIADEEAGERTDDGRGPATVQRQTLRSEADSIVSGCVIGIGTEADRSPCEALGFPIPYVVRTVQELARQGVALPTLPLTAEALVDALALSASSGQGGAAE